MALGHVMLSVTQNDVILMSSRRIGVARSDPGRWDV